MSASHSWNDTRITSEVQALQVLTERKTAMDEVA